MNETRDLLPGGRIAATGRRLVTLRWWLLGGLAGAVLAALLLLDVAVPWPLLLTVLLLLAVFNVLAYRRVRQPEFSAEELGTQLAVDLVGMGVMLYLAGGATNPLVSLLLLPVAVAALVLSARWLWGIAALAIGLYSFLMLYSLPLPIADAARAARLHLGGMWLTFVVSAVLIAWFVARMTASIRERDAQLAQVREQALRDAQVVALGQLAAGAAHELGTPLATMSVLAGELTRDARLPDDARADLELLQRQLGICKDIVGNLTQRAGVTRAGTARRIRLDHWLEGLLGRWRTLWPQASCILELRTAGTPPQLAVDGPVEQALNNLLDNAARCAPHGIRLTAEWQADRLRLAVCDYGAGFPPEVLMLQGVEPLPGHAQGSGIGLWLARAAVERAGGSLRLENTETGGKASIELPLGDRK